MDSIKRICIIENPTITHAKKDKHRRTTLSGVSSYSSDYVSGILHKPPPKKRAITTTKKWDFPISDLTLEYQLSLLNKCFFIENNDTDDSPPSTDSDSPPSTESVSPPITDSRDNISRVRVLEQLIHSKWYGYRSQDIEKQILHPDKLVSERDIANTLIDSRLLCFYCRKPVQLFYEFVRESSQWTLDRIDNTYGHNRDNVVVACLGCNLRRKTMYYERFVMTKQMTITKTGNTH